MSVADLLEEEDLDKALGKGRHVALHEAPFRPFPSDLEAPPSGEIEVSGGGLSAVDVWNERASSPSLHDPIDHSLSRAD